MKPPNNADGRDGTRELEVATSAVEERNGGIIATFEMRSWATDDSVLLTEAEPGDEPTLWLMLTYAASMSPDGEGAIEAARADRNLRGYVEGWGRRAGDLGVIAAERLSDGRAGEHLGAAWLRLGDGAGPFKVGDRDVPELATAVLPAARGRGIGAAMLKRLTALATGKYPAIALSVRESNPAVRFYARLGFRETGRMENRVGGVSLIMRLPLPDPPSQPIDRGAGAR